MIHTSYQLAHKSQRSIKLSGFWLSLLTMDAIILTIVYLANKGLVG